jgi:tRNA nucleotidyltransferase (CCA-adding enzyme)
MELLNKVSEKITPKEDKILKKEINEVVDKINSELKKLNVKATAVVGGSFAKETHLIDDHDCDIFARFDYKYKDQNISDLLEKVLRKFKATRLHGSRDYFLFRNKLNFEVVPVLNVSRPEKALNVTDVSPLHVAWVKKRKKNREIRLAKAFCKAQNIYGAESYIKGFSGHVLDILTIYYGSFMNLLKASQKWKEKTVIDIHKEHKDALFELNASKIQGPLIVIDPIQPERNASAALGNEAFETFIEKAKEFLKNPSERFFEKKTLNKKDVKDAIILDVVPLEGKKDVIGAKIMKAHEAVQRELESNGFKIKDSGWAWNDETFIWFKLKDDKLNKETTVQGPPVKMKEYVAAFKKKHKKTFEKKGKLYAKTERKYTDAKELIRDIIKSKDIKERVKSIEIWR